VKQRSTLCAAVLMAMMSLSACSDGSAEQPLKVFAASSLTGVLPQVDADARYQFAGSDDLALQLTEGAKADVFAAASPTYPTELHESGVVEEPSVFATNRLVLIVPKNNPAGIASVEDLSTPGVTLVIGAEGVPVGDYTRRALDNLKADEVLQNVVSEEQDVKAVVAKVTLGEADAGFVYATDVKPVEGDVLAIELPRQAQPVVEYMVAVVSSSDHATEARAYIDRLLGEEGRSALRSAGFGVP
jgi:molybdate transport system substrate-binding protein